MGRRRAGRHDPVEFADTIYNVDLATRNDVDRPAEAIGDGLKRSLQQQLGTLE
jgi:hypothetical protein